MAIALAMAIVAAIAAAILIASETAPEGRHGQLVAYAVLGAVGPCGKDR